MAKKVAVILTDRANYGRIKSVMIALREIVDLRVLATGSMVLRQFGYSANDVIEDDFSPAILRSEFDGDLPQDKAKSLGLMTAGIADWLGYVEPDIVLLIGDRYGVLAAALAAGYMVIPIIHFQGGERSGTIDDYARDAITLFAKWHVPATEKSAERLRYVGVKRKEILTIGCPSSDIVKRYVWKRGRRALCVYHPEFYGDRQMQPLFAALQSSGVVTNVILPNIDAGRQVICDAIKQYPAMEAIEHMPVEHYLELMATARFCIGNSSSFVREGSMMGVPVVLVSNRQRGREQGENCIHAVHPHDIASSIGIAMRRQPKPTNLYGDGHVTERFIKAFKDEILGGNKILEAVA